MIFQLHYNCYTVGDYSFALCVILLYPGDNISSQRTKLLQFVQVRWFQVIQGIYTTQSSNIGLYFLHINSMCHFTSGTGIHNGMLSDIWITCFITLSYVQTYLSFMNSMMALFHSVEDAHQSIAPVIITGQWRREITFVTRIVAIQLMLAFICCGVVYCRSPKRHRTMMLVLL